MNTVIDGDCLATALEIYTRMWLISMVCECWIPYGTIGRQNGVLFLLMHDSAINLVCINVRVAVFWMPEASSSQNGQHVLVLSIGMLNADNITDSWFSSRLEILDWPENMDLLWSLTHQWWWHFGTGLRSCCLEPRYASVYSSGS